MQVLFLPLVLLGQPTVSESTTLDQPRLKQAVLDMMRADPSSFTNAKFEIDSCTLYYRFGGFTPLLGSIPSDLFDIPLAAQATVETIKKYPRWGPIGTKVWEEPLAKVEGLIAKELALISAHKGSQQDLFKTLANYQRQTDAILFSAMAYFGQREKRSLQPFALTETVSTAEQFRPVVVADQCGRQFLVYQKYSLTSGTGQYEVEIQTKGAEALCVLYMTVHDFYKAKLKGTLSKTETWHQAAHRKETLGGNYFFRVRWNDGTTTDTGVIRVINSEPIIIRAK